MTRWTLGCEPGAKLRAAEAEDETCPTLPRTESPMPATRSSTKYLTRKISTYVDDRASIEVKLIYVVGRPIVALDLTADQELLASYTLDTSDHTALSAEDYEGQSMILNEHRLFHLKRDAFLALIEELAVLHRIHPSMDDFTFEAAKKLLNVVRIELENDR